MELELPDTLSRYFEAQNAHDAEGMTNCFAPDAMVRDEGRTYAGRDAIHEWKRETIARYGVSVRPLSCTASGGDLKVIARVEGNFPGSPADLTYAFTLDADGLIRALEIH
jgi:hypothetical protein